MWILQLNPMRANAEHVARVAWADSKEDIEAFEQRERVAPYTDGHWAKCYRKGGPLEWFNPPDADGDAFYGQPAVIDIGNLDDWEHLARLAREYFASVRTELISANDHA